MNTAMKPLLLSATFLLGAHTLVIAQEQPAAATDQEAKQVRIEPQAGALQLDITGIQSQYAIGEPIRFQVRGNRAFYLWAYARDPRGTAMLLVPGQAQTGNKYQGGWNHTIPNQGLKILADEAGPHEITLIASTRWLDIDLTRRLQAGESGIFTGKAATFDEAFAEKGLRLQDGSATAATDTVIRRFAFGVSDERRVTRPTPPAAGAALPFVRMDRADYRLGDSFRLVFGATEDGYVHVFLREPDGNLVRVIEREVRAHRAYEETGSITEPAGPQRMVVMYSRDGRLPTGSAQALDTKGVTLDRTLPNAAADYPFTVRR